MGRQLEISSEYQGTTGNQLNSGGESAAPHSARNGSPPQWANLSDQAETPLRLADFAHPAELDLARIFSFYRVRWVYEPTTFHLEVDSSGKPLEQVTPDFYLPDYDLYIELTTMRQSLVTRKNRKIRRLKEMFPDLRVKLLYRKDYDRLIASLQAPVAAGQEVQAGRPLFSERQIEQRISTLANELIRTVVSTDAINHGANGHNGTSHPGPLLLGLGNGSRRFLSELDGALQATGFLSDCDWLSLTSYSTAGNGERVRINRKPRQALAGRNVILVAGMISSGLKAAFAVRWLERQGVHSVGLCALLNREDARILELPPALVGFDVGSDPLAGFGIAYQERFADLPHVAVLRSATKSKPRLLQTT